MIGFIACRTCQLWQVKLVTGQWGVGLTFLAAYEAAVEGKVGTIAAEP